MAKKSVPNSTPCVNAVVVHPGWILDIKSHTKRTYSMYSRLPKHEASDDQAVN